MTEQVLEKGISTNVFLVLRSLVVLTLSIAISARASVTIKHSLDLNLLLRIILSGVGMLLVLESYKSISATSVATIQKTDIVFISIIGLISGQYVLTIKSGVLLSISASIVLIILYNAASFNEDIAGYSKVILGVVCLSISTFFTKRLSRKHNEFILINISCYSGIIIGTLLFVFSPSFGHIDGMNLLLIGIISITTFLTYFEMAKLYKTTTPEFVQYPTLIGSLIIFLPEMAIENKTFDTKFIILNILYLGTVTTLIHYNKLKIGLER